MELHVGQTVCHAVRRTDCRRRRRKLTLTAGGAGGRRRRVDVQAAGGRRRILRGTLMGGRWKNFNFKIVGNRFFLLATVARLRVEFSALLHEKKNYKDCILTRPEDTRDLHCASTTHNVISLRPRNHLQRNILIDRRPSTAACPAFWAMGTQELKKCAVREKIFLLGQLEAKADRESLVPAR
jgi:hypothetical protein